MNGKHIFQPSEANGAFYAAADVLCTKDRSDVRTGCNPEPERTLGKLQQ